MAMVCLKKIIHLKFFKGCLTQILLGLLLVPYKKARNEKNVHINFHDMKIQTVCLFVQNFLSKYFFLISLFNCGVLALFWFRWKSKLFSNWFVFHHCTVTSQNHSEAKLLLLKELNKYFNYTTAFNKSLTAFIAAFNNSFWLKLLKVLFIIFAQMYQHFALPIYGKKTV